MTTERSVKINDTSLDLVYRFNHHDLFLNKAITKDNNYINLINFLR